MKLHAISIFCTLLCILSISNSALADVGFITDSIYITCLDKGDNKYEVFGKEVVLPKDFFKRVRKPDPKAMRYDASSMQGGLQKIENVSLEAYDHLDHNEFDLAKKMFEQAYKLDPNNYGAQNGYLRFHINEFITKVVKDPEELKTVFKPFKSAGETILKEYLISQYLQLISMLCNEKGKKRIVSTVGRDVKLLRNKFLKLVKKDAKENKDEIQKLLTLLKGTYYTPTVPAFFAKNKHTKDYFEVLDILDKIAKFYEITENLKTHKDLMQKKLAQFFVASDIGAYVNKKINDDNVKIRAENAKSAAFSTKEKEVLILLNDYREVLGIKRLKVDSSLSKAASDHAYIMNKAQNLTHESRDGSKPIDRAKLYGYKPKLVAENIQKIVTEEDSAETILMNWILSEEHNQNMLNPKLEEIGIGSAALYWVQLFGTPEK